MPKAAIDGIELYYEVHGPEGADWLVLSNGVMMSTASWAYQVPELSRYFRLLLYDCRGMWQSDHPPGPYTMELHAQDLAALMDALEIERAHIGGISYGAELSMVFARDYPDRTRSLILSSAVSQVDSLLEGLISSWTAAVRARDPEMLYQVSYPLNFSEAWIEANAEALQAAQARYQEIDMDAMLALLECFSGLDITADLHKITVPTLVIVGEEDALKPRKYAEIIAAEIPHADLAIVPHAGHAVLWEQWRLFNTLILGFLTRQEAPQ